MDGNAARTTLLQKSLCYEGFNIHQDGIWGGETARALQDYIDRSGSAQHGFVGKDLPATTGAPEDTTAALVAYYGQPEKEFKQLKVIELPYQMVLAWNVNKPVSKVRCHEKAADSLLRILSDIEAEFGRDGIIENGLHLYGGCYNHRKMRGGSSWSRHAWGIAIDLNPDDNGLKTPWDADKIGQEGFATMPVKAIEIFERHGWKSYAKSWGKDAMHFQATR
jgi:hypothetical protein